MNTDHTMPKILIVEDDPLMSRMYERVFKFERFDVKMAANGKIGLERLRDFKPEIILIDVMMPVMNGQDMLAAVKANPNTRNIPVIMLTNLSDPKASEDMVSQGAEQYIIKSKFSPPETVTIVRDFLEKQITSPSK